MALSLSAVNKVTLQQAAIWYTQQGFKVFPCVPGAKEPLVNWAIEASVDEKVIRYWWDRWPDANIGVPMGAGIHTLDIDNKAGQRGSDSYRVAGGVFPIPQPLQSTPNGGLHVLFKDPRSFTNFTKRGPCGGLDMRSDRGYILGAPSMLKNVGGYRWIDGDLDAPLAQPVLDLCAAGPATSPVDHTFQLPTPSNLTAEQINQKISGLDPVHEAWLLRGESPSGDNSHQAYLTCLHAFMRGWTLADMAAVGPHTELATFGAEPPHGASDPWAWCIKYTIQSAWISAQAQLARVGEPQRFSPIDAGGSPPAPPARAVSLEALKTKAESLDRGDTRAVQALVVETLQADLPPDEVEAVLVVVKEHSGYGLTMLRGMVQRLLGEIRTEVHAERAAKDDVVEVWIRDQGKFFNQRSGQLITRDSFVHAAARRFGGDVERAKEYYLTGSNAACPTAESLTYDAALPAGVGDDARGVPVFNTYQRSNLIARKGDVSPWRSLLQALTLEGGTEEENHLLDWVAWLVQYPGKKINHGVLLGGAHGVGKDSWLAPVLDCVGRANVTVMHGADLASDFTDWQARCKVAVINEIDLGEHRLRRQISEVLKPALASPPDTLRINEKNVKPYTIPNRLQCFGFTNHRGALHIDSGERRWLALWCRMKLPPATDHPLRIQWDAWFKYYWTQWLPNGGYGAIYDFLLSRDLSQFNPGARPRTTLWLEEMMQLSMSPLEQWIAQGMREKAGCFALPVVDFDTLLWEARQMVTLFGGAAPSIGAFRRALGSSGLEGRRSGPRGKVRYFPKGVVPVTIDRERELLVYRNKLGVTSWAGDRH